MSPNMGCNSVDNKTKAEKPTGPIEAVEKSTDVGKDFLVTRSSHTQEKIEARAALVRGRITCAKWLDALPARKVNRSQEDPPAHIDDKIPEPSESMGREICTAAGKLKQAQVQIGKGKCTASVVEYILATSWAHQRLFEHQKCTPAGSSVQSRLFELPTGYAVEYSVGEKLIEQRHFVEDVLDELREDDTPPGLDEVKFLAARHSDEQCFVCEKLGA